MGWFRARDLRRLTTALTVVALLLQGLASASHATARLPADLLAAQAAGLPIAICTGGRQSHIGNDGLPADLPRPDTAAPSCPLCTLQALAAPPEPGPFLQIDRLEAAASLTDVVDAPAREAPARVHGNRGPPG